MSTHPILAKIVDGKSRDRVLEMLVENDNFAMKRPNAFTFLKSCNDYREVHGNMTPKQCARVIIELRKYIPLEYPVSAATLDEIPALNLADEVDDLPF